MAACPKCGDVISIDARACACGWRRGATVEKTSLHCAWNGGCGLGGCVSEGMNGGGPWFCAKHWCALKGQLYLTGPTENYRSRWYRERDLEYQPPKTGNLKTKLPRMREPGEDEVEV